jgi:membrane protein YdbS with pleckstrin-like domain
MVGQADKSAVCVWLIMFTITLYSLIAFAALMYDDIFNGGPAWSTVVIIVIVMVITTVMIIKSAFCRGGIKKSAANELGMGV